MGVGTAVSRAATPAPAVPCLFDTTDIFLVPFSIVWAGIAVRTVGSCLVEEWRCGTRLLRPEYRNVTYLLCGNHPLQSSTQLARPSGSNGAAGH
jgi:hypothetical protein